MTIRKLIWIQPYQTLGLRNLILVSKFLAVLDACRTFFGSASGVGNHCKT
jgi:hypothetical protein